MKNSTNLISIDRATCFFFFVLLLFAVDMGLILHNEMGSADGSVEAPKDVYWGAELVIMAFAYLFYLFVYLIYLNFRHWIPLLIVQFLSVCYFFFVLIYDLVRTQNSIGKQIFMTNKFQVFDFPWVVTPFVLYTPSFLLFSFMLYDEVSLGAPPKRAFALERVVSLAYYLIKKVALKSKSSDRWDTKNKKSYVIQLDRNLIYYIYVLILISWNLGMIFNNLEHKENKYHQREMILMCCFYFLFLFALYFHFCLSSFTTLVLVQLLSVFLFMFQWIYDLAIMDRNLGFPHVLGIDITYSTSGAGAAYHFNPVYVPSFLFCSFLLRYAKTIGVPSECGEVYTFEGIGWGIWSLVKFVKKKIFKDSTAGSEFETLITDKNVLGDVEHDDVTISEKDLEGAKMKLQGGDGGEGGLRWIAFERPVLYFLLVLFLFSTTLGTILCNMSELIRTNLEGGALQSMELNTQQIIYSFLLLFLLILSFWNVCVKDVVSLLFMQLYSLLLFFVFMIYSISLARKKAVTAYLWKFDWDPWVGMSDFPMFGPTFLLTSFLVQNEVRCCQHKNQAMHYYSLEGVFSFVFWGIYRLLFGSRKKMCGGGSESDDGGKTAQKKKCCCGVETSLIYVDRGALYYLIIVGLFSMNLGMIIQSLCSETKGMEYQTTELIITSLFYFFYVMIVALYLNIRCPFSLIFVQLLSVFIFFFRSIYDFSLANHKPASLTTPVVFQMFSGGELIDGNNTVALLFYTSALYLLSFCVKCDRVGCGGCDNSQQCGPKKEGGYYALEGLFMMGKCLVGYLYKKFGKSGAGVDSINEERSGDGGYEYVAIMEDTEDSGGYGSTEKKEKKKEKEKQENDYVDFTPGEAEGEPVKVGEGEEEEEVMVPEVIDDDDDDSLVTANLILDEHGEKVASAPLEEGEISIDDE